MRTPCHDFAAEWRAPSVSGGQPRAQKASSCFYVKQSSGATISTSLHHQIRAEHETGVAAQTRGAAEPGSRIARRRRSPGSAASGRRALAVAVGKAARGTARRLGRGGGSAIAGRAALAVDARLLAGLAAEISRGAVMVTGTNGKGTT